MFDYGYRWEEVDYTKLDNESTAKSYLTHEDYAPYQYIKTVRGGTFNFTLAANSIKVDLVELDPTAVTVNVNESLKNSGHKVFVEGWDDDDLTPNLYAEATVNGTAITFDLGEDFYGLTGYQILELRDGITSYDGSDYSTKVLRPTTHCDIDDINVAWDDTFKVHYKSISHSDWADVQLQQDTSEPGYYLTGMSFHAGDIFCLCVDNYWLNWNDKNTSKMQSSAFVKDDDTDNIKCTLDGDYIIHASTTDFYIVDADELSAVYKAVINGDQAGAVILDNKQAAISVISGDHISIYRNDVLQDSISLKTGDNNLRKIGDGIFEVIATTEPVGENKNLILNNEGLFLGGYAVDNNYYLRGDMNGWRSLAEYKFTKGTKTGLDEGNGVDAQKDGKDQYFINNLVIENPADFKAFSFTTYYPGTGANLSFTEAGTYNIYFVPEGEITDWNSFDDRGYFWIYKHPVITGITAAYTGSNVVTGEHIVGGISLHVTYDKELEPAVLAPDAEGVFYSLNGGNYITYDELIATTLELSDPGLNNEENTITVKYLEYEPQQFNVVVVKQSNLFATVAIKNQDSSADVTSANMFVGDTLKLSGFTTLAGEGPVTDSLVWSSSNEAVVSVDEEGLLTAHAAGGPVTITLASYSGNATPDTCSITVVVHIYYTAMIVRGGDETGSAIAFDDCGDGSWVSHEPVNFNRGDKLNVYYENDPQTFVAEETLLDRNNLDPDDGIFTSGECLVYLTPTSGTNGTIWVKGYARIVYDGVSYAAEHKFESNGTDETYYIEVNAVHGKTVTAGYIGNDTPIALSLDNGYGNNLTIYDDKLSIITTAEHTTIYMHDITGHSVWADNYEANITVNGTAVGNVMQHTQDAPEGCEDQYYKQISVTAGNTITFYDNGYPISVAVVSGNAELVTGNVVILANCATADLYLKAYSDHSYRLWVSGLDGYYLRSKTGALDVSKHFVDSGEEINDHTQYVLKNVILAAGDKVNFFGNSGFVMADDYTVTALKAGTYDIYLVVEGSVEGWNEAAGGYFYIEKKTLHASYSGHLIANQSKINIDNITAYLSFGASGHENVEDNSLLALYYEDSLIDVAEFTFNSQGTKTVEVRYLGLTADMTITVDPTPVPTTSIHIQKDAVNCASAYVFIGDTLTLTVARNDGANDEVTWTSSNPTIATVVNGLVTPTGTSAGVVTITATANNHSSECTVTVRNIFECVIYRGGNPTDDEIVFGDPYGSNPVERKATISVQTNDILKFYRHGEQIYPGASSGNLTYDGDSQLVSVTDGGVDLDLYLKDYTGNGGGYDTWFAAPLFKISRSVSGFYSLSYDSGQSEWVGKPVSFKSGETFSAVDKFNEVLQRGPDNWSFGSQGAYGTYISYSNGVYTVLQDFVCDVYVKASQIYFGTVYPDYYISGTMNSWADSNNDYKLVAGADGVYRKTITITKAEEMKVKTYSGDTWYGASSNNPSAGNLSLDSAGEWLVEFYPNQNGAGSKYIIATKQ